MSDPCTRRAGRVIAGRARALGSDPHSPERSTARSGRDEGGPLRRPRGAARDATRPVFTRDAHE